MALDCGLVVNPLAVRSQAERSVVMESSAVDVGFVADKTNAMGGVGEPIVSPVTAAVANAVYDAVGIRLREVPFTPDRVLAALAAR